MNDRLFEQSYARIFGDSVGLDESADAFFQAFYHRFLNYDYIAKLFDGVDMNRQVSMLRRSLFHLSSLYITNIVTPELKRFAAIHERLKIAPAFYDTWLECLLETVAEFDPQFDIDVRQAWRDALVPGVTVMKLFPQFT